MKSLLPLNIQHKTGFKILSALPSLPINAPKTLGFGGRWWQVEVFNTFQNKYLTIYIGACASGKSLMCITCAADVTIKSNWTRRHIIAVPQRDIGNGFSENKHQKLKMPDDGKIYDWKTYANLCGEDEYYSVSRCYDFIVSEFSGESARETNNAGGTSVIVTKQALIMLWKKLSHEEKLHCVKNIDLWDDESHHTAGVTECEEVETNVFGEIVKFYIDNGGSVHLFTATYLRNDARPILSKNYMNQFTIYRLSDHDYLETTGIQEMIHDFVPFDNDKGLLKQLVNNIKKEKKERHIIYVPAENQGYFRGGNKWGFINKFRSKIEKLYGRDNVLDLVTPSRQEEDKKRLFDEVKKFSIIIACGMAKEGSDWTQCSRVHNTVLDRGLQITKQKNGRTWRSSDGKLIVKTTTYVQNSEDWNKEETLEVFGDRLLASCVSTSLIDDIYYPIYVGKKKEEAKKKIKHSDNKEEKFTLDEILGENLEPIRKKILKEWLGLHQEDKTEEKIKQKVNELLDDCNLYIEVEREDLADALTEDLVRRVQPRNYRLRTEPTILKAKELGWTKLLRNGTPFQANLTVSHLKELDGKIREMYSSKRIEISKDQLLEYKENLYTAERIIEETGCTRMILDSRCIEYFGVPYVQWSGIAANAGLNFPVEFYYDCAERGVSQKIISELTGFFYGQIMKDCIKKTGKSYVELVTGKKKEFSERDKSKDDDVFASIVKELQSECEEKDVCNKLGITRHSYNTIMRSNGVSSRDITKTAMLFRYCMAVEYGIMEKLTANQLFQIWPDIEPNFSTRVKFIYGRQYTELSLGMGGKDTKSRLPMMQIAMMLSYREMIDGNAKLKDMTKLFTLNDAATISGNIKSYTGANLYYRCGE